MTARTRMTVAAWLCGGLIVFALFTRFHAFSILANVFGSTVSQTLGIHDASSTEDTLGDLRTIDSAAASSTNAEQATTTTAFAISLMEDYIAGAVQGDYTSTTSREALVQKHLDALLAASREKQLTLANVSIDRSGSVTIASYIESMMEIIQKHNIANEHEIIIFDRALRSRNPQDIAQLDPIIGVYSGIFDDLSVLQAPESLAKEHLALMQATQELYTALSNMRKLLIDPTAALVGFSEYQSAPTDLANALAAIHARGKQAGVTFPAGTAGAEFMGYTFTPQSQ